MDKTAIAVGVFDKLADLYQQKFMNVELYANSLDFFCSRIPKQNAEILELACGPGNITQYLLKHRPDFKILGFDLAPNMIALAKINNPSAEFQVMDCRKIGAIQKKYDAILCGFCLPYFSQEETMQFIRDASTLLVPNGLLYISTMEDDYANSGFRKGSTGDEIFMHFYQEEFLKTQLSKNHFNTIYTDRKVYPAADGTNTTDLILIAEQ